MLNSASVYAAPTQQVSNIVCPNLNERSIQPTLNKIIEDSLRESTIQDGQIQEIIDRQWRKQNLDFVFDRAVDNAIVKVRKNEGFIKKFSTNWSSENTRELSEDVTNIVLQSEKLKKSLENLLVEVSNQISIALEKISADSSIQAFTCLQNYIGKTYTGTFTKIFNEYISETANSSIGRLDDNLNPEIKLLSEHKFALGGIAIAATVQITKRISRGIVRRVLQQFGERVLGRIGSAAIPVVGEVIAAGLLVYDIFNSFDGALPAIKNEMKKPKTKNTIKAEIANSIENELQYENNKIAYKISSKLYSEWLDFKSQYLEVIDLAKESPKLKIILNTTTPNNMVKLSKLVHISLNYMGRLQLKESIQDGTFKRVLSLPEISYKIIETKHDLSTVLKWNELAGAHLEDVIKKEFHKYKSPENLDRQLLLDLLSFEDPAIISKLLLLNSNLIRGLLKISRNDLIKLCYIVSVNNLENLARTLSPLDPYNTNKVVKYLVSHPSDAQKPYIIKHIIESKNIAAAIRFLESDISLLNLFSVFFSFSDILTGKIHWKLLIDKYSLLSISIFSILSLFLFILIGFLLCKGKYILKPETESKQ